MGKNLTVASKFTEDENEQIEVYASFHGISKSQLVHDFVMQGIKSKPTSEDEAIGVGFYFTADYAYFWKGRTYRGVLHGDNVSIKFGGEWKNYKLSDLPVEVVE